MGDFQELYNNDEMTRVRFVGFTTDKTRYDLGIVYTNQFFGKPLIICMQTGRSVLLDPNDLHDIESIQKAFQLNDKKEASDLIEFLRSALPATPFQPQYE